MTDQPTARPAGSSRSRVFNQEQPKEATMATETLRERYESTTDEAVDAVYELIDFRCSWSTERIEAIGRALGGDGLDLEQHQRARSIEASLRALRDTAHAIFYLLPDLDEEDE